MQQASCITTLLWSLQLCIVFWRKKKLTDCTVLLLLGLHLILQHNAGLVAATLLLGMEEAGGRSSAHRNTTAQGGSFRDTFVYIKTLLYKLKERKKKKQSTFHKGRCVSAPLPPPILTAVSPTPVRPECCCPCRNTSPHPSPTVSLLQWLSESIFCLQRKLSPRSSFLNLFM